MKRVSVIVDVTVPEEVDSNDVTEWVSATMDGADYDIIEEIAGIEIDPAFPYYGGEVLLEGENP